MSGQSMRAVRQEHFGGPDVLTIESVPIPEPLPTEVLVRVAGAGVNPVDWKTRAGAGMAGVLGAPPFVLGWDVAGVVERVGFGVTTLRPGDAVYGMPWFPRQAGAYAEYVTAPSRQFAPAPTAVDALTAAAVPLAGLTAWQALVDTAGVTAGQRVLVHAGAGGVGHLAVQIAVARGATVIATAGAAREEFLRGLGATEVIDYRTARFDEDLDEVDVVLDLIGGDDYGLRSVSVTRSGGLYIGVPGGVSAAVAAAAAAREVRSTGILVEPDGAALAEIATLIDQKAIRVEIAETYPLDKVAEAHRAGEDGHVQGKLVLAVNP